MKASIVVLFHDKDRVAFYSKLVNILLRQKVDFEYELIGVDDNDSAPDVDGIQIVKTELCSPSRARNLGWMNAKGEFVVYIDSDCVPDRYWLGSLLGYFDGDEGLGAVGGAYWTVNSQSVVAWCVGEEIAYRQLKEPGQVEYLGTYSVAYRRGALEEIGGFDEDFARANSEDNDLSYRLGDAGYSLLFTPMVKVGHFHPHYLFKYVKQQSTRAYWRVLLYKKHRKRINGDGYSGVKDFIQAPASLVPLTGVLFLSVMQVKEAFHILRKTGKLRALNIVPLNVLRGFAWAHGLAKGFISFGSRS